MHPGVHHSVIRRAEIIDPQEEANATGELVSDDANLMFAIGTGKEDARLGSRRPDNDPALWTPLVCQRR